MHPTRIRTLIGIAVTVGLLAYLASRLVYADLPALPAYSPLTLVLVALVNGYLALAVRDRRSPARPVRIEPLIVARYAALSKASSVLGAFFAGVYLGLLGYLVKGLDKPHLRADARVAAAGAVAALLLVVAALLLERACRVPRRPDPDDAEATDAG
ncbi:MAG: hypothetical protein QOK42_1493 [Frankiaceae bacterium]|jgi:Na+/melibiose symporter-like transporter|nr:hypothetical protein [Frankiaceae bacterium]